jgi:hypothetical protein
MSKVDICGLGTWSPMFSDWPSFCSGLETGEWSTDVVLQPTLIPPRERRRAPQLVKMAIEVMDQACKMASLSPSDVAVVFSSSMGDMQITDYMCHALAETPKLISPTRFHNSVHNAAPGYWSITTGAFTPTSAVSAHEHTSTVAFVEAAIQAVEENTPVVLVTQEVAAPLPLFDTCPSKQAFSAAFLMTPPGFNESAACSVEFSVSPEAAEWPAIDSRLNGDYASSFGARLLPLMTAIADGAKASNFVFPISNSASLSLSLKPGRG